MESSESEQLELALAKRMREIRKVCVIVGLPIALMALWALWAFGSVFWSSTILTKRSPDGHHTAKLTRTASIDLNLHLYVDGKSVYNSPDLYPGDADIRENLIWSTDNQTVVLELAGRRIFGYQATERRALTDTELLKVPFKPLEEILPGATPRADPTNSPVPASAARK